jgi:hypothetical protein
VEEKEAAFIAGVRGPPGTGAVQVTRNVKSPPQSPFNHFLSHLSLTQWNSWSLFLLPTLKRCYSSM